MSLQFRFLFFLFLKVCHKSGNSTAQQVTYLVRLHPVNAVLKILDQCHSEPWWWKQLKREPSHFWHRGQWHCYSSYLFISFISVSFKRYTKWTMFECHLNVARWKSIYVLNFNARHSIMSEKERNSLSLHTYERRVTCLIQETWCIFNNVFHKWKKCPRTDISNYSHWPVRWLPIDVHFASYSWS